MRTVGGRLAACVSAAIFAILTPLAHANRDGAQPRKSGGPFPAESVCTECHSNSLLPPGPNRGPGSVNFSVQPYTPGQRQRITITVADPTSTQIRWGFQITARPANSLSAQAGTFDGVAPNSQVICDNDRPAPCPAGMLQFPTHTLIGTRRGTRDSVTFEVDWTAPPTNVGDIIFAAAGNAANGSDTESGDNIYTRQLTVSPAASGPTPQITAGGVIGAGLSTPPVRQISLNGIISIFGENFAPAGTVRLVGSGDLVDGKLPTNFGGVCVLVGNQFARFFHLFPNQLNVQTPTLAGSGSTPVQVILNCGGSNEVRSNVENTTLQDVTPEFFFFVHNADGRNPIAAINAITFGFIGAPNLITGATFTPAKPGDILALFATGFGATDPAFQAGELPPGIAPTAQRVTVTVGGTDADVLYAGVAPGLAGLYQINIRLSESTPDGDLAVVARIGGISTPAGAFITVRR